MLEKTYDASTIEPKISEEWIKRGVFKAGAGAREGAAPFCVVIPPPNVTGSLHMGHALNNTIQDILVRFYRMRGRNVLWQPGMDHAGIATQMVVERELAKNNEPTRQEMGRKEFVARVWQWRKESGGKIATQLKRLGASCDWSRERFTMDEGLSQAVREVFVRLYKEGLIYKDKRLVNWDPKLKTAISDLELEQKEVKGHLWYFRYPLENKNFNPEDPKSFITIATTRPETLLGDVAIAVNPEDSRYKDLVGESAILPLVGRKIAIVADSYADPEAGSGAVKITPAHDFNDFEVGKRHQLRAINVLDAEACMDLRDNDDFMEGLLQDSALEALIELLHGQSRFVAREKIVSLMEERGFLLRTEEHRHMVPHGDRGGVPIEPRLTDQWYLDAEKLAGPAIKAVEEGKTTFIPANWDKTYYDWMKNIQPWCISRQLWWGHQIPAWYGPDGKVFVEKTEEEAYLAAQSYYGKESFSLHRDEDVLDTWFSSALWPFSTLGWPHKTQELAFYYPTATLVTGFDIIFFWVARMMMMGLHFMKEVPFSTVYVHALVRDKHGAKMSKSKGNVIDPLDLIDTYGADALRFALARMAAQGRDVKLDPVQIASCRNFATKLWNATRFSQMNGAVFNEHFDAHSSLVIENRWILTQLALLIKKVTASIEQYKFNEAAFELYRFIWNILCDWYLELVKPILSGENTQEKQEVQNCLGFVLLEAYKLLHPFMPFITEELWSHAHQAQGKKKDLLVITAWPTLDFHDERATQEVNWLVELLGAIRSVRAEMRVPPKALLSLVVVQPSAQTETYLSDSDAAIKRLGRIADIKISAKVPPGCAQILVQDVTFCLILEGAIDIQAERARLSHEVQKIEEKIARLARRVADPAFLSNAKAEVVDADKAQLSQLQSIKNKLQSALERL